MLHQEFRPLETETGERRTIYPSDHNRGEAEQIVLDAVVAYLDNPFQFYGF